MNGTAAVPMRLQARDLGIGYGRRAVAAGITFDVAEGEIFCLLGPNGCGKTTLFRTLLGLLPPLSGRVRLDGRPPRRALAHVDRAPAWPTCRRRMHPPSPIRSREVVLMGRTAHIGLFSQPGRADRLHAQAALEQLGIAELADADYSRLSGGQRQLVLIARALAGECTFMIMDEPTASLDYGNRALVLERIRRLAAAGHRRDHVQPRSRPRAGGRPSRRADARRRDPAPGTGRRGDGLGHPRPGLRHGRST